MGSECSKCDQLQNDVKSDTQKVEEVTKQLQMAIDQKKEIQRQLESIVSTNVATIKDLRQSLTSTLARLDAANTKIDELNKMVIAMGNQQIATMKAAEDQFVKAIAEKDAMMRQLILEMVVQFKEMIKMITDSNKEQMRMLIDQMDKRDNSFQSVLQQVVEMMKGLKDDLHPGDNINDKITASEDATTVNGSMGLDLVDFNVSTPGWVIDELSNATSTEDYKSVGSLLFQMVNQHRTQLMQEKRIEPVFKPVMPVLQMAFSTLAAAAESCGQIA